MNICQPIHRRGAWRFFFLLSWFEVTPFEMKIPFLYYCFMFGARNTHPIPYTIPYTMYTIEEQTYIFFFTILAPILQVCASFHVDIRTHAHIMTTPSQGTDSNDSPPRGRNAAYLEPLDVATCQPSPAQPSPTQASRPTRLARQNHRSFVRRLDNAAGLEPTQFSGGYVALGAGMAAVPTIGGAGAVGV